MLIIYGDMFLCPGTAARTECQCTTPLLTDFSGTWSPWPGNTCDTILAARGFSRYAAAIGVLCAATGTQDFWRCYRSSLRRYPGLLALLSESFAPLLVPRTFGAAIGVL